MIVYITREQRIWQVVCVPSELLEKLYFICNLTNMFLLNLIWRSIFWNTWWIYGLLYSSFLYNFLCNKVSIIWEIWDVTVMMPQQQQQYNSAHFSVYVCPSYFNSQLAS